MRSPFPPPPRQLRTRPKPPSRLPGSVTCGLLIKSLPRIPVAAVGRQDVALRVVASEEIALESAAAGVVERIGATTVRNIMSRPRCKSWEKSLDPLSISPMQAYYRKRNCEMQISDIDFQQEFFFASGVRGLRAALKCGSIQYRKPKSQSGILLPIPTSTSSFTT